MPTRTLLLVMIASLSLVGCGGGGTTEATLLDPASTASFTVDIVTNSVVVSPFVDASAGKRLGGKALGFKVGALKDVPGHPNERSLDVSLVNHTNHDLGTVTGGLKIFVSYFTGRTSDATLVDLANAEGTSYNFAAGRSLPYLEYAPLPQQSTSDPKSWVFKIPSGVREFRFKACAQELPLRLPGIFQDHMVLQRNSNPLIWGWAAPGDPVTVTPSWGSPQTAIANKDGLWSMSIKTGAAGGPYEISVSDHEILHIRDVMLGEVWLCSGQSNMEYDLSHDSHYTGSEGNNPDIRLFKAFHKSKGRPSRDVPGDWRPSTPQSAAGFSAVGYYFAKRLNTELHVPVGIIQSTWGGTMIEYWMAASTAATRRGDVPLGPGSLFNGMIHPLIPYGLKGFLWYQGEDNVREAGRYPALFAQLIQNWRLRWGNSDLPFYFVQIAPFQGYKLGDSAARMRESQLQALSIAHTGMVVTTDLTPDATNIHPNHKLEVGERQAKWALVNTYRTSNEEYSGPLFLSSSSDGNSTSIKFTHSGGLRSQGASLTDFEIAGRDRVFVPALAVVNGETVVVSSPLVSSPVAVRYGWSDVPTGNLVNGAGLPASPFRTDRW